MPLLTIKALSKNYREGNVIHRVLNQLDLELTAGESAAILGRSGCGKSTLLNLIAGIDLPDSGSIRLQDQNLNQLNEQERTLLRRQQLGFVFQFFNLVPTLTVLENILLPLELIGVRDGRQRVLEQLEKLQLADRQHSFPEQLSGGEQQRVAIVRALIHKPKLLLADEPTGNLDQETGDQVADLLFEKRDQDAALIVVTHSQEIAARADHVYRLQDGQLNSFTDSTRENVMLSREQ